MSSWLNTYKFVQSLPTRGAWIEIFVIITSKVITSGSLPTRGAWIEIAEDGSEYLAVTVAPHTGSVD